MNILLNEVEVLPHKVKFDVSKIQGIELIERELYNSLSDSRGAVREMCSHILNAGGKRVRPILVLYSGLVFGGQSEELVQAAIASELIHMASLVHDDIIDNSSLRRSRPSINKIWGNHFAVLCGDYLFARAFGIMSRNRLIKSMDYMVEAIENMCEGEILQAGDLFNCDTSQEVYYEKIGKKTAIFLQCCCKSGAAIAGAGEAEVEIIGQYGLNLGYAFQIIDDIFDFCGNVENIGKPKCEDLPQGNITMPVIMLLNNEKYGQYVREIICKKEFSVEVLDEIALTLRESGIISECYGIAGHHIQKAKKCLELLPQSEHIAMLQEFANMLQARVN